MKDELSTRIKEIAEEISQLDTDGLYTLAQELVLNHRVPAYILRADLEIVE